METTIAYTPQQIHSIKDAIKQCDNYIVKEEKRAADLRPADIQNRLNWTRVHRDKLAARLASASA